MQVRELLEKKVNNPVKEKSQVMGAVQILIMEVEVMEKGRDQQVLAVVVMVAMEEMGAMVEVQVQTPMKAEQGQVVPEELDSKVMEMAMEAELVEVMETEAEMAIGEEDVPEAELVVVPEEKVQEALRTR